MIQIYLYLIYSAISLLLLVCGLVAFLAPGFIAQLSLSRLFYRVLMAICRRPAQPMARWRIHGARLAGVFCLVLAITWLVNLHPQLHILPQPRFDPAVHQWQSLNPDGTAEERQDLDRLNEVMESALNPEPVGNCASMCLGAIHGERTYVLGIGEKHPAGQEPPDGDTVFEIGSITKTFTGALLASLAGEGAVSLDDPVASLLPGWRIPEWEDRQITLNDLATHRSGLPRMPDIPMPGAIMDLLLMRGIVNPYRNGTGEFVREFLAQYELPRTPGARDEYSNLGMGLLGYALGRKMEQPFETLLRQRILDPLGMTDTAITLTPEQTTRLAQGYIGPLALGRVGIVYPMGPWTVADGFQGCGALKSTVRDMLKYIRANIVAPDGPLGTALARIQEPQYDVEDLDHCKIGLGMMEIYLRDLDGPLYWHNGGTGGYNSFMGVSKKYKAGVVMLCAGACDEALGHEIIRALTRN